MAMETKVETAADDRLVQLGIWTVSWYQHTYDLRALLLGVGPKPHMASSLPVF